MAVAIEPIEDARGALREAAATLRSGGAIDHLAEMLSGAGFAALTENNDARRRRDGWLGPERRRSRTDSASWGAMSARGSTRPE
jgi:hypothetical protein